MRNKNFKGFYETLRETLKGEENNVYYDLIRYTPDFFRLLCKILIDKNTEWHTKLVINSALAYFVVPNDVIPEEEYGAMGYIDDIFICTYVLKLIKEEVSDKPLVDNWEGEEDVLEIVDEIFKKSRQVVGDKSKKILAFAGLIRRDLQEEEDLDARQKELTELK